MKASQSIVSHLFFSLLLALSIPLAANAEPQSEEYAVHGFASHFSNEGHSGYHFGNEGTFHFPSAIELTESQRDQIFSIKHKQEALLYEQSKIIRKAHIDLRKLATSDQYDDDKAKAITGKFGKALGNIKFLKVQESIRSMHCSLLNNAIFINAHRFNRSSEHSKDSPAPDGEKLPTSAHLLIDFLNHF